MDLYLVAMKKVTEINEAEFESQVLKNSGLVLVDFYAPWCGPCRMIAPVLEALAEELNGKVKFVKVNVDQAPYLAMRYGISGVPTLILFKNGLIIDSWIGVPHPRSLKERLLKFSNGQDGQELAS